MESNVVSLTGIPIDASPPPRMQQAEEASLVNSLLTHVVTMLGEVNNIHRFSQLIDEHGDDVLQSVGYQMSVLMRHFDNRLNEMESLATELNRRNF